MKYSFDSKCLELAEHFLPANATQAVKNELAQAIQNAAEDFTFKSWKDQIASEAQDRAALNSTKGEV